MEPIVIGPGSSSVPLREMVQAHPGLQLLTLRTRLLRHHLHWPLLLFQRRLRLLSPHPGDIKPRWDLGPLLLSIRDHVGGPRLPNEPGHQARVSQQGLGPSRRPLLLIRVRCPNYPRLQGSGARCLAAGLPFGVILRHTEIDSRPAIQRFYAVDPAIFTAAIHDYEAIFLSPGGA